MAAAAPISARLGVAAACLLPALYAVDAAGIPDLNSCPLQSKCIEWSMTEVPEGDKCTADAVTNAAGESCPGIWKVCMKIRAKGQGKYATCPELMVRSICPNDSCPAAAVPPSPIVPAHEACGSPLILPAEYCQYGAPGDVLKFFVQDGDGCESPDSHGHPEWPHEHDTDCRASVKCRAAVAEDHACKSGCDGDAGPTPCVHEYTIPSDCGCEATTSTTPSGPTTPTTPPLPTLPTLPTLPPLPSVESMPPGDPLAPPALGLAASGKVLPYSSALAMASAFSIAAGAAVGAVAYRRLGAAPSREQVREMDPLEVGLTE
mmetsp:Transcript_1545/g.3319  ORF Transcript_1545/g.3319 Transcript_1545/m.3319 type:complete len:318 (+) Transcript_1545:68-1021(+)